MKQSPTIPSSSINWEPCHDDVWALDGGERSASCSGLFTPGEIVPGTHWIEGWVGPRASLDTVEKRKISCPCQESNLAIQPIACHYTNWVIPAHSFEKYNPLEYIPIFWQTSLVFHQSCNKWNEKEFCQQPLEPERVLCQEYIKRIIKSKLNMKTLIPSFTHLFNEVK
jgi:hypothetical protein